MPEPTIHLRPAWRERLRAAAANFVRSELDRGFCLGAGGYLLALALALLAHSLGTSAGSLAIPDPVLNLPMWAWYGSLFVMTLVVSLVCLFGRRGLLPVMLVGWLVGNVAVYRLGLAWSGGHSLVGYFAGGHETLGISASVLNGIFETGLAALGAGAAVCWVWWRWRQPSAVPLKMSCPACGVHIQFAGQNLGRKISCPQCRQAITLRPSAENLKISCFFCQEHIEFPAHALGTKMPCPHCRKDITLKEPV